MSEWLTTGQMIDTLKDGEIAEPQDQPYRRVKRVNIVGLCFVDKNGEVDEKLGHGGRVVIGELFLGHKWRILPNYVSFEEAMKALKEGKYIEGHHPDGSKEGFFKDDTVGWGRFPKMIEHAKWSIEGDSDE